MKLPATAPTTPEAESVETTAKRFKPTTEGSVETSDLAVWLRPHCANEKRENGEPRPPRRAVLVTGAPARRNARDEYATIELTGRDPHDCAREIEGAVIDYHSADPTFLEVREEKSTGHKAVKKLDADPGDAKAPPVIDMTSMMGCLVTGITASNATLSGRVNHLERELAESTSSRIELAERAAVGETLLIMEREKAQFMAEHSDEYGEALKMLGPIIAPFGDVLAAKFGGPVRKPEPGTPGDRADRAIAEVLDLAKNSPDVLKERKVKLYLVGEQLQKLLAPTPEPTPKAEPTPDPEVA